MAGTLALYVFALPPYAAHRIRQALLDAGLNDWTLEVRAVSWHGLELANLHAGEAGRFKGGSLRATYGLGGLLRKELRRVELDGFEWEIRIVDGALDLGPLASVHGGEGRSSFSIDRIDVKSSTLIVRSGATSLNIPFSVELTRTEEGRFEADIDARLLGQPLRCVASLTPGSELIEATLLPGPGADERDLKGGLAGGALLHATCELDGRSPSSWALDVAARWPAFDELLAGLRLRVQEGEIELHASSDPSQGLAIPTCKVAAQTVSVDGRVFDEVRLDLAQIEEAYRLRASASGRGWRLEEFVADLPHALERWLEPDLRVSVHAQGSLDPSTMAGARFPAEIELPEPVPISLRTELIARPTRQEPTGGKLPLLRLLESELLLGPTRGSIPRLGLSSAVLDGAVRFAGSLAAGTVELALQGGSELRVRGSSPVEGPSSSKEPPSLLVELAPPDAAGRIAFCPQVDLNSLELDFPQLRLVSAGLSFAAGTLGFKRANAELPLAVSLDARRLALRLTQPARLEVESICRGASIEEPLLESVGLELSGDPVLELARAVDGSFALPAWNSILGGEARCTLARPLRLKSAGFGGTLRHMVVAFGGKGDGPRTDGLPARAELTLESLLHASSGLRLDGVTLELAGSLGGPTVPPTASGHFGVESITWRQRALRGPKGTVDLKGAAVKAATTWSPTATSALELAVDLQLDGGPGGALALHSRRLEIRKGDALESLLAEVSGAHFTGGLTLDGRVALDESAETKLTVAAQGCSLAWKDEEKRLEGVGLQLALAGLAPLRTTGAQRVTWERGNVGKLALEQGQVRFALESPSALLVEGIEVRTAADSHFSTLGFRVDPSAPDVELEILCENVSLGEVLAFISTNRSTGEGTLHGRIGLSIGPGPQVVTLGAGRLFATEAGRFQVQDPGLADDLLRQGRAAISSEGMPDLPRLLQERILGALADFAFRSLTFELLPKDDRVDLRISTQGQGAKVPQDLDMTINLRGFDDLFAILLGYENGLRSGR